MNSKILLSNINDVVKLDEDETAFLESVLIPRPYKQGETIVSSGETANYIMFINSGYLMTYYTDKEGLDHVIQFGSGGWWAGDIYNLNKQTRSLYTTKGLCDGEVLLLPRMAQSHLLENYIKFERYFRILFQNALLRQQLRFVETYTATSEERYVNFTTTYPEIEKFVPQKYIASYLGITPEFLSKIRKKLSKASE